MVAPEDAHHIMRTLARSDVTPVRCWACASEEGERVTICAITDDGVIPLTDVLSCSTCGDHSFGPHLPPSEQEF